MIWPASVPVMVELWPAQSRAIPKRIGAALPRNDGKSRCASSILATSSVFLWKTAALRTRMAALMKERRVQGNHRVDQVVPARPLLAPSVTAESACLDEG